MIQYSSTLVVACRYCAFVIVFSLAPDTKSWAAAPSSNIEWVRQIGTSRSNEGRGIAVDESGNPYLLYNTQVSVGPPGVDFFVAKYDPNGSPQWTRQFGTSQNDTGRGMAADTLGNVLVTGTTQGPLGGPFLGDVDGFLTKIASDGTTQWTRQLGTSGVDFAYGVSADHSGNVLVVGETDGVLGNASFGGSDAFVVKYDVTGNVLWTRQFGSSNGDTALDVASDTQGNIYVVGETAGVLGPSSAGGLDVFLTKLAPNGNILWTRQFGTNQSDSGACIDIDPSGQVYVAGATRAAIASDPFFGEIDAFLSKFSPAGDMIWTRQWGTSNGDEATGVGIDAAFGGVLVSGYSFGQIGSTNLGGSDAFVTEFSLDGNLLWTSQFGTTSRDYGMGIAVAPSQRAYVAGITEGSFGAVNAGGADAYLAKLAVPEPTGIIQLQIGAILFVLVTARWNCQTASTCQSTLRFAAAELAVK
jgi:hypothetical protein